MKKQDKDIGTTKIYLVTNCYNNPNLVYVGKTTNSREYPHKLKYGEQIEYTIIDEIKSLDVNDWKPLETYWINQFKAWGFEVLNKNEGGGGPVFLSNESKIQMSQKKKGKKRDEEIKIKISSSMKGKNNWTKIFWQNAKNTWSIGEYYKKPILQYDMGGTFIREWSTTQEAASFYNIQKAHICNALNGRSKSSKGFIWKYKI
jgi:hypothetical protein